MMPARSSAAVRLQPVAAAAPTGHLRIAADARSPALDLQRRLEAQVMRGFYAPSAVRSGGHARRALLAVVAAIAGWGAVFGAGVLVLG